jgi:hypothetical protein
MQREMREVEALCLRPVVAQPTLERAVIPLLAAGRSCPNLIPGTSWRVSRVSRAQIIERRYLCCTVTREPRDNEGAVVPRLAVATAHIT